jgi:crossover junction endodeoxyribonuclease RusA
VIRISSLPDQKHSTPPASTTGGVPGTVRSVAVVIPMPSRALNPNSRAHWATLAKHKARAKQAAILCTIEACQDLPGWPFKWQAATVHVTLRARLRRNRDKDNLLASLKASLDGVASTGLIVNDSGFSFGKIEQERAEPGALHDTVRLVFECTDKT